MCERFATRQAFVGATLRRNIGMVRESALRRGGRDARVTVANFGGGVYTLGLFSKGTLWRRDC
jgi:hypothetical protein